MEQVEKKQYNDSAVDVAAVIGLIAIAMTTAIFWLTQL
jgi:hypothetical protein